MPSWASSTIRSLMALGRGLPFTNTPPSWFTSPKAGSASKHTTHALDTVKLVKGGGEGGVWTQQHHKADGTQQSHFTRIFPPKEKKKSRVTDTGKIRRKHFALGEKRIPKTHIPEMKNELGRADKSARRSPAKASTELCKLCRDGRKPAFKSSHLEGEKQEKEEKKRNTPSPTKSGCCLFLFLPLC